MKESSKMDRDSFEFVIFMIHRCANKWHITPADAYRKIESVGCVSDYLVPLYDILHTQSADFVLADIEEYLENRGIAV